MWDSGHQFSPSPFPERWSRKEPPMISIWPSDKSHVFLWLKHQKIVNLNLDGSLAQVVMHSCFFVVWSNSPILVDLVMPNGAFSCSSPRQQYIYRWQKYTNMMIELRCKMVDFPAASSQHGVISPPIPGKSSDLSESSARTAPMSASSPIHLVDGGDFTKNQGLRWISCGWIAMTH